MIIGFLPIAMFLAATSAWALDVDGIKVEDKATVGGRELVLNGAGVRTRAIFKVYVGETGLPLIRPKTTGN